MIDPVAPRIRTGYRALLRRLGAACGIVAALSVAVMRCAGRRDGATKRRATRAASAAILRALGVRVRRRGRPPAPGALVVANHLSYLDVLVLASATDARFVAKREVASWPVVGGLARAAGTLFVDRASAAALPEIARSVADAVLRGETVILFPEGTTGDGSAVLPFRSALLADVARRGVSVVPIALRYRCEPPHDVATDVAWCGDRTLLPHLAALPDVAGLRCELIVGSPRRDRDRKRLAEALRADVLRLKAERTVASLRGDPSVPDADQRLSAAPAAIFNGRAANWSAEPAT